MGREKITLKETWGWTLSSIQVSIKENFYKHNTYPLPHRPIKQLNIRRCHFSVIHCPSRLWWLYHSKPLSQHRLPIHSSLSPDLSTVLVSPSSNHDPHSFLSLSSPTSFFQALEPKQFVFCCLSTSTYSDLSILFVLIYHPLRSFSSPPIAIPPWSVSAFVTGYQSFCPDNHSSRTHLSMTQSHVSYSTSAWAWLSFTE